MPPRFPRAPGSVGRNVPRKEGAAKVEGTARYVDDLQFPGMLHGRTVRAPGPCGRLRGVRLGAIPAGLIVVDVRDIPGRNVVAMIEDEATVKRFYKDGKQVRLQAENPAYAPIMTDNVKILGRVIMSIRQF